MRYCNIVPAGGKLKKLACCSGAKVLCNTYHDDGRAALCVCAGALCSLGFRHKMSASIKCDTGLDTAGKWKEDTFFHYKFWAKIGIGLTKK